MNAALRHTDSFMLVAELAALQCKPVPSGAYLNSLHSFPSWLVMAWCAPMSLIDQCRQMLGTMMTQFNFI